MQLLSHYFILTSWCIEVKLTDAVFFWYHFV